MKRLLILLLSLGILIAPSIKADTVLYCQSELATGFSKTSGSWKEMNFSFKKYTIKFNDDYSRVTGMPDYDENLSMECETPYSVINKPHLIYCVHSGHSNSTLRYNTKTKRFVHYFQPYKGYIGNGTDTDVLYAGNCKIF